MQTWAQQLLLHEVDRRERTRKTGSRPLPGLALTAAFKFTLLPPQRAERGMDVYRRRPPLSRDPDPALGTLRALFTHLSLKTCSESLKLVSTNNIINHKSITTVPPAARERSAAKVYFPWRSLKTTRQLTKIMILQC